MFSVLIPCQRILQKDTKVSTLRPPNAVCKIICENAIQQNFSFPKPMLKYINSQSKSGKVDFKLLNSCKYFSSKRDLIVPFFDTAKTKWQKWQSKIFDNSMMEFNPEDITFSIWLAGGLCLWGMPDDFLSEILPKVFRSDITDIHFNEQSLTFYDFNLLVSNHLVQVYFRLTTVYYSNGAIVPLEKLLGCVPNIQKFNIELNDALVSTVTTETAHNLIELINPRKMKHFELKNIPEIFDFTTFSTFMMKNYSIHFNLEFSEPISVSRKEQLESFVDKVLETPTIKKQLPCIKFPGIDLYKRQALYDLSQSDIKLF